MPGPPYPLAFGPSSIRPPRYRQPCPGTAGPSPFQSQCTHLPANHQASSESRSEMSFASQSSNRSSKGLSDSAWTSRKCVTVDYFPKTNFLHRTLLLGRVAARVLPKGANLKSANCVPALRPPSPNTSSKALPPTRRRRCKPRTSQSPPRLHPPGTPTIRWSTPARWSGPTRP